MRITLGVSFALLLCTVVPAVAQQRDSDAFAKFVGRNVMVKSDEATLKGVLARVGQDSVYIMGFDGRYRIYERSEIDAFWIKTSSPARGAKIGAVVGATTLGLFAAYLFHAGGESDKGGEAIKGLVVGTLGGAGIGGALGYLFGGFAQHWQAVNLD